MPTLTKSSPLVAVPGTLTAADGEAVVSASQVIVEEQSNVSLSDVLDQVGASPYLFYFRRNFQVTAITTTTAIPEEGYDIELLPETQVQDRITPNEDFITQFFGAMSLEIDTNGELSIELRVTHRIASDPEVMFTTKTPLPLAMRRNQEQTFALNHFDSISVVPVGTPITIGDNSHTFGNDQLTSDVYIKFEICLRLLTAQGGQPKAGNITHLNWEKAQVRSFQIKTPDSNAGHAAGGGSAAPVVELKDTEFFAVPWRIDDARPDAFNVLSNRETISTATGIAGTWTVDNIPDDGGMWLVGWLVAETDPQPTRFSTSGFDFTNSIAEPFDVNYARELYFCYLFKDSAAADHSYNGTTIDVVT